MKSIKAIWSHCSLGPIPWNFMTLHIVASYITAKSLRIKRDYYSVSYVKGHPQVLNAETPRFRRRVNEP